MLFSLDSPSVYYQDRSSTDESESAAFFSDYFSSVFKSQSMVSPSPDLRSRSPFDIPSNIIFLRTSFLQQLLHFVKLTLLVLMESLCLLYNCRSILYFPIYILYRYSINKRVFSFVWKTNSNFKIW